MEWTRQKRKIARKPTHEFTTFLEMLDSFIVFRTVEAATAPTKEEKHTYSEIVSSMVETLGRTITRYAQVRKEDAEPMSSNPKG